ncbi:DMT family transporter [Pelagibacteraceae bacterium]|nr:DMT family transporter [Pelagibacteraceae bacterium]
MSKNFKAIMLALIASFCAVLMSVFLKLAQEDSNVFTIGFLRFFFGLLLITPFIFQSNFKIYNTINFKLHILRCIINVPMMIFGFAALTYIPLEQIKAIGFLSPILVVILSVIFLGERIYLIRTFSLILGFIGTLIILRPGFIEINIGVYMVLASALLWSCVIIITKFMSKNDSAITILTFQYTFVTLFTLPLAIIYWNTPSFISLIYTLLAAIVGTVLHLCINNAYKLSDLSIIQPVWFTQLVFASFLGFIIFGSLPDFFTWIGAILVFISVLIITYRENYLKKDIAKTSIPLKN